MQNVQYRDLFYTKIPRALRFNDRVSMMHSCELREPFLDYRLVELAFSRPDDVKWRDGQTKWMLRQIARNLLGDQLSLAPKRPLQTPQREWLANELNDWSRACIDAFAQSGWANSKAIENIWHDYVSGHNSNSFFIWQWINAALILESKKVEEYTIG
jgi:asparagine synthase (glutamine-hydrolysing)